MGWQLIQSQSLSASAASVTFSSIPQTYKSLQMLVSSRSNRSGSAADDVQISINGSTASFTTRYVLGSGTVTGSYTDTNYVGPTDADSATALTFNSSTLTFPNYISTSTNKPFAIDVVTENNGNPAYQIMMGSLWSNTSAITSITLNTYLGNFVFGSTFTLYGLA